MFNHLKSYFDRIFPLNPPTIWVLGNLPGTHDGEGLGVLPQRADDAQESSFKKAHGHTSQDVPGTRNMGYTWDICGIFEVPKLR